MKPRVLDLFCGAGGFSEGFRQAGYHILGGSDVDPDACATYGYNFPGSHVIWGDIRSRTIRAEVAELAVDADILVGGPPCQAFSQVRNHDRAISDPRNSLYREFVQTIASRLPLVFVMENVPGLAQMQLQEQITEDLSLDGEYSVHPQVVDACDFGVPQTRKRIIFVGVRRSLRVGAPGIEGTGASAGVALERSNGLVPPNYVVAARTPSAAELIGWLHDEGSRSLVTTRQALSDLCFLETGRRGDILPISHLPEPGSAYQAVMREGLGEELANVSVPRINADTVLRLQAIPPGGNYRDLPGNLHDRYLTGQKWGPTNGSGRLTRRHYYAYRRLHPDIWAWTLNTKADSVYHWLVPRALSVREFARLQSFPDRFVFTTRPERGDLPGRISGGAAHSRYRQVGNAVPPLLARAVADALVAVLSPTPGESR